MTRYSNKHIAGGNPMKHSTTRSPHVQVLMRGHHYAGGISGNGPRFKEGGKCYGDQSFKTGSHVRHSREHHFFGQAVRDPGRLPPALLQQIQNAQNPQSRPLKRGGHAQQEHHFVESLIGKARKSIEPHAGYIGKQIAEYGKSKGYHHYKAPKNDRGAKKHTFLSPVLRTVAGGIGKHFGHQLGKATHNFVTNMGYFKGGRTHRRCHATEDGAGKV